MLIDSQRCGMKPKQIAKLLRLLVDEKAKLPDRHWVRGQLIDARENMSHDDFAKAVKELIAKNRRLQSKLKKCLSELSLSVVRTKRRYSRSNHHKHDLIK